MRSEILDLIFPGESESLEFKSSVRDPLLVARLISSFANAHGGKIVIGVKEPPEITGVDENLTRRVYEASLHRLTPKPNTNISFLEDEGKRIAIIAIERSPDIVLAEGSAYVRAGSMTQPMAWRQMLQHLPAKPTPSTIEALTKAIEKQSKLIGEMHAQIQENNSWRVRWKERLIAFGFGVVASYIASVVYARF